MEGHLKDTDNTTCPTCGGWTEEDNRFCVHCGSSLPRVKKRFMKGTFLFGATGMLLAGSIWFFAKGGFESRLVGRVNSEEITRKEFSSRVDRMKNFYESRYGQALFEGDKGKENLNRLKVEILEELIEEKILLQEAKRAGYDSAPEDEIRNQLDAIKKMSGLSETDIEKRMGASIAEIKADLKKGWMISQFVEKAVLKGDEANKDRAFQEWLTQVKAQAKIETFEKLDPVLTAKASCCTSGCGGGGKPQPLDPKIEKDAKSKGLEYFEKKTQRKGASAQVTNFGCHIQVDIIEEGKIVTSLTYRQGEVQEI